ncbi:hypothetical protein SD77_4428 [Bacillus badius]|uniref:Uncharacterized protein n=1 Tax=Bacillus badius TaxID=1455 RepID=A0ABR5AVI1_BACBA|nr:hypothetical protein SD77_4428 [Bacillus badius]
MLTGPHLFSHPCSPLSSLALYRLLSAFSDEFSRIAFIFFV